MLDKINNIIRSELEEIADKIIEEQVEEFRKKLASKKYQIIDNVITQIIPRENTNEFSTSFIFTLKK